MAALRVGALIAVAALAGLLPAQALTRREPRILGGGDSATLALNSGSVSTAAEQEQTATGRKVIADGHVDMGPRFVENDAWTIQIRDDSAQPIVWRNLVDVVLHAVDASKIQVPADPAFAFLGQPGDLVFLLPQSQQAGILWPGWNTQHTSVLSGITGPVNWDLTGVSGPGQFSLFLTESFGAVKILFDSAKPFAQTLVIPPNTHVHGNWSFSKPGIYRLGVRMSGTRTSGGQVSDTKTLVFAVGNVDPSTGFSSAGSGGATTTTTTRPPTTTTGAGSGSATTTTRPPTTTTGAGSGGATITAGGSVASTTTTRPGQTVGSATAASSSTTTTAPGASAGTAVTLGASTGIGVPGASGTTGTPAGSGGVASALAKTGIALLPLVALAAALYAGGFVLNRSRGSNEAAPSAPGKELQDEAT
ncbi:MAG: TIGR03773 family transporter-associated surface protein [Actinomycetota bacterium]